MPVRKMSALAVLSIVCALAACSSPADDSVSVIKTTTNVAGAAVLGIERDTTTACPLPAAPDDADGPTRTVAHAGGETIVPADPQRIVVLSTQALDSVCGLGLWERVVGAATLDGPVAQPNYLGTGIAAIPGIGPVGAPDLNRIRELQPDLILGSTKPDDATAAALSAIAPTVYDGVDGGWKRQFGVAAQALGRASASVGAVLDYQREAEDAGVALNSGQTQASVVLFTADSIFIQGPDTFAGNVMTDTGVRRPGYQQGGSVEISADDLADAEGDIIYVMFEGDAGKEHGIDVMKSDEWEDLGAAKDRRVFNVEDTIWNGNGVVAARTLVSDLLGSLNGYVS
ncbi:ABC transporter substrate-binding protein [Antrihabitans sp. YC2-6]|uniref:ABC transporter substrate-binding protein n=1 Tax=Antrihabitans sp. YC2-6 TaxID=2799498 RepID=UPI0018F6980A|nr:ABC transporter substrate-binding protein [Antrihabitans sp. YC2-6]MBJ8343472.1 ABC transporter substrate-binding protein [Antrihabitans sp. YC2-6]